MTEDEQLECAAFEMFATAHPHEAYETWPERFWTFFHGRCPDVPRDAMERLLNETDAA